jgi:hypothetical protein
MVPADLIIAQERVYKPCSFIWSNLVQEKESQEYSACTFDMNNHKIVFRVAKITPTKTGQFVTLWKRIGNGPIMPFDMNDPFDRVIISVRQNQRLGQFVFPKSVLYEKGFVSKDGKGGKRAMRIYSSWDAADSKQAQKTQAWQSQYFFEVHDLIDSVAVKRLLA